MVPFRASSGTVALMTRSISAGKMRSQSLSLGAGLLGRELVGDGVVAGVVSSSQSSHSCSSSGVTSEGRSVPAASRPRDEPSSMSITDSSESNQPCESKSSEVANIAIG
ncbi:hypothetical protein K491DRAFT_7381 [Lophiostoma macrostomum CBS 122681]|uniref:Uncharacterized protein n=1 Tax=Lophiostoma macrostomum CBS 122681 TaxID=1314788 RepID=A0A6A6TWA6_9PLEO|nr:hypothetical protein K491DRAFT_7381 [Lophiostoma macrostomum CBS 122681]